MSENLPENKPKQPKTFLDEVRKIGNQVSKGVSIILFAAASLGACGKAENVNPQPNLEPNTIVQLPSIRIIPNTVGGRPSTLDFPIAKDKNGKDILPKKISSNSTKLRVIQNDENKTFTVEFLEEGTAVIYFEFESESSPTESSTQKKIRVEVRIEKEGISLNTWLKNTISNIPTPPDCNGRIGDIFRIDLSGITTASGEPASFEVIPEHDTIDSWTTQNGIVIIKTLANGTNAIKIKIKAPNVVTRIDYNGDGTKDIVSFVETEEFINHLNIITEESNKPDNSFVIPSNFPTQFNILSSSHKTFDLPVIKDSNNDIIIPTITIDDTSVIKTAILNKENQLFIQTTKKQEESKITLDYISSATTDKHTVIITKEILVHVKDN